MDILFNKDRTARLIEIGDEVYLKTKEIKRPVFKIFYFNNTKYYLSNVDLKMQMMWKNKYALFEKKAIEILEHNKVQYILIQVDTRKFRIPVKDIIGAWITISVKGRIDTEPKYMYGISVALIILYPEIDKIDEIEKEINDDGNPKVGDKVEFGGNIGIVQALTEKSNHAYVKFPLIGTRLIKRNHIKRSGRNEWREI